ncbi:uncharacterized protein LOC134701255 [Mytilus trossulus]|uniref:uncharacterized protein LOC134701255 n=1 Tax=Mytilus trossulus TaxID=6551 RepID=UPI003007B060
MATHESVLLCDVCKNRHMNKSAEEYCPLCEEALCRECRDHHKASKLLKSHQTIPVEKYRKLPLFIQEIKHNCEEHDCFLEFHCKFHDVLCCKLCLISGHKECKETIFIEDFLTPSSRDRSAALDNVEKVLKDLESNISTALKDRNRNLTELREQKQVISKNIREKRQQIDLLLDRLEEAILEKASTMEKVNCQKIEEVITKLNEEKKIVDEIQKDVESVKLFASNLQIFMGTKAFLVSVSANENKVQKLYDIGSFNNVTFEFTFNEKLEAVIKEINTLGDMKVDFSEKHVSFSWKSNQSAQIYKSISEPTSIEEISVKLVQKINIGRNTLSGCAISEAGNMLFLQAHKNNLLTYCPNGELHSESCILKGQPGMGYDLAVVDSEMVAVSSGGNPPTKIHFIDMSNSKLHKTINCQDWCYGLSYHNGSFICCTHDNGIKLYDTSQKQNNIRILPSAPRDVDETYVTSNEKSIFHSNWRTNSVVCYNYNGQVQWTYSDALLRKPYGITLDSYSNIYVVGSVSNNVVVISKDGQKAKQLIGASDGIFNPRAVYFHKTKNVLLVANYDGVAFLFDV